MQRHWQLEQELGEAVAEIGSVTEVDGETIMRLAALMADEEDLHGLHYQRVLFDLVIDHLRGNPPSEEQWAAAGRALAGELVAERRYDVQDALEVALEARDGESLEDIYAYENSSASLKR